MTDERVLVVEDTAQMRAILHRALGSAGYHVDLASTLTEARGMDPGGYDAVLIDANLGAERGTDLVKELQARDEGAGRRCLIITGGSLAALPDGIASLAKPFQLTELLAAVRALHQPQASRERHGPDTASNSPSTADPRKGMADPSRGTADPSQGTADPSRAAASTSQDAAGISQGAGVSQSAVNPAAAIPPQAAPATSGGPAVWELLAVTRRLRARERDHLADHLHDGPIQDLAAATLELHLLRRSAAYAQSPELDTVLGRLDAVAGALRAVMAGPKPPPGIAPSFEGTLRQQATWLAAPLTVDHASEGAGLAAAEAAAVVDVAELMLFAMTPGGPPAEAHADVLAGDAEITVRLIVVPGRAGSQAEGPPGGERAAVRAALDGLATVLAASIGAEFGPGRWRSWTTLPRALPPGGAGAGQGNKIVPAARPAAG